MDDTVAGLTEMREQLDFVMRLSYNNIDYLLHYDVRMCYAQEIAVVFHHINEHTSDTALKGYCHGY